MGIKNKRFVLHSKEAERKDTALKKQIVAAVLVFAVFLPFLTEGVLETVIQYTDGDIALSVLDTVLRYLVIVLRYAAAFIAYAAVAASLVHFGPKGSKGVIALLLAGTVVYYMVASFGSWIYCYNNGLLPAEEAVEDVFEAGFNYFFLTVYSLVKNAVLVIMCCVYLKKQKKKEKPAFVPDESLKSGIGGFGDFAKCALNRDSVFFKLSLFCAAFDLVFSATVNFFSYTLFQLITDGAPENALDVWALASSYVLMIPGCVFGFFLMAFCCLWFSLKKSSYRP